MSLVRFKAQNHRQQLAARGVRADVDNRATDPRLFAELDRRFHFTVDACADATNHKLDRYFDESANGLIQPWRRERIWCNPPFSDVRPWVQKAWADPAELAVLLVPANRTEQAWWQELVEPFRDRGGRLSVEFLSGRIRFVAPGKAGIGPNERPPFGCCLLIWSAE